MFDSIIIGPEQSQLLEQLVDIARNVRIHERQRFKLFTHRGDGTSSSILTHPGLKKKVLHVYLGDIDELVAAGFIRRTIEANGAEEVDVTSRGYKFYQYLKQQTDTPLQQVEETVKGYIDTHLFTATYPIAYSKWSSAAQLLWSADSAEQLTTIGHLCREAIQEFATALVNIYQPPDVETDKARDISRISAVLRIKKPELGSTEQEYLESLISYWRSLNKLIQRQEHGGQREGQALVWEDARRIVFQTAIVFYEIDRALNRLRADGS